MRRSSVTVWSLGNATVRNPKRIIGALRVFKKYFDGKNTFSGNPDQEREFFEKLLTHTKQGEEYLPGKTESAPIYSYVHNGEVQMPSKEYKEKNGRLWLSPMDYFGFIDAYWGSKARVREPGEVILKHPHLKEEIWLRQLLKYQYPNPKSALRGGGKIRPAVLLFKLMLELNGLSQFEIGLAHLQRDEEIKDLKSLIKKYRERREREKNVAEKVLNEAILRHFEDDFTKRLNLLKNIHHRVFNVQSFGNSKEAILPQLNKVVAFSKGPNTNRANSCKNEILRLFYEEEERDFEKYKEALEDYYTLVKSDTIGKDYPDLAVRYMFMSGVLERQRINGEIRITIIDRYKQLVKEALKDLPPIRQTSEEKDEERYFQYLWNTNKPSLLIDDEEYLHKKIKELKARLSELDWAYDTSSLKLQDPLVQEDRILYNYLKKELRKAREAKFAEKLEKDELLTTLKNFADYDRLKTYAPREIESKVWESLLNVGGYMVHPSKTRNFHVDDDFQAVFTAAGDQPDMQFPYEHLNLVVEVTKSRGKTQWRSESEPVTRHTATQTLKNDDFTMCIFLAPEIHPETRSEFYHRSKGQKFILESFFQGEKIQKEVQINIVPLTYSLYFKLYKKVVNEDNKLQRWLKIMRDLSKLVKESKSPSTWMGKIEQYIEMLK